MQISILDLKTSNIFSLYNAIKLISNNVKIYDKYSTDLKKSDLLILPGVGTFRNAMNFIKTNNLIDILYEHSLIKKKKLLGICLGMQLLFDKSEENGNTEGLKIVTGEVKRFKKNKEETFPHIGWKKNIFENNLKEFNNKYFYFIHSYFCQIQDESDQTSYSNFGSFKFCSSIQKFNIYGFQFHPEKSGAAGLQLLKKVIAK
jgi:glutamine amidotransferase